VEEFSRIIKSDNAIPILYKNLSQRNVVGILGSTVFSAFYEKLTAFFDRKNKF